MAPSASGTYQVRMPRRRKIVRMIVSVSAPKMVPTQPPRPPPISVPPMTTAANILSRNLAPISGSAEPIWAVMNMPAAP